MTRPGVAAAACCLHIIAVQALTVPASSLTKLNHRGLLYLCKCLVVTSFLMNDSAVVVGCRCRQARRCRSCLTSRTSHRCAFDQSVINIIKLYLHGLSRQILHLDMAQACCGIEKTGLSWLQHQALSVNAPQLCCCRSETCGS